MDAPIVAQIPHEGVWRTEQSDAPQGESLFENPEDYFAEALHDQAHDRAKFGDDAIDALEEQEREQHPERQERFIPSPEERTTRQIEAQPQDPEQQPTEVQPMTTQEVHAGLQHLESAVAEMGLNTQQNREEYVNEFCAAFGTDPHRAQVNIDALSDLRNMTAVSALSVYSAANGDPQRVPPIDPLMAQQYSHRFFTAMNLEPRKFSHVDPMALATTAYRWDLNFIDTWARNGGAISDLRQLNDGQAAMMALGEFYRVMGVNKQPELETALKFADAYTKPLLKAINAWQQMEANRQGQGSRSNTGRGKGQRVPKRFQEGIKGSKAPRFTSNQDIFDQGTMQTLAMRHL